MKEKPNHNNTASPLEELDSLIGVLRKKFDGNIATAIKIKKFAKEEKGMVFSIPELPTT